MRLPEVDGETQTLEETEEIRGVFPETSPSEVQEKEIVQVRMEEEALPMAETLDRADHPSEGPRGYGQAEWEVCEHIHHPVHNKGEEALEKLRHRHAVVGILQIHRAAPKTQNKARRNIPDRLHPEPGDNKELVEPGKVYNEAQGTTLLWNEKEPREEERLAERLPNLAP